MWGRLWGCRPLQHCPRPTAHCLRPLISPTYQPPVPEHPAPLVLPGPALDLLPQPSEACFYFLLMKLACCFLPPALSIPVTLLNSPL